MPDEKDNPPGGSFADSLKLYLKEIGRIPMLSRDEESDLAARIQNGDFDALQRLVEANLRFVVSIAKRYNSQRMGLLDIINEGNVGLMEAAKRFDPNRNVKFISYAVWWIRQAIVQALADQGHIVRLPLKQAGLIYRINEKFNQLTFEYDREPTMDELATALRLRREDLERILMATRQSIPIENPSETYDPSRRPLTLKDNNLVDAEQELLKAARSKAVQELMNHLDSRAREILKLRFGFGGQEPLSLEKIGRKIGLTRERIRQIEKKAKKDLQRLAGQRRLKDFLN